MKEHLLLASLFLAGCSLRVGPTKIDVNGYANINTGGNVSATITTEQEDLITRTRIIGSVILTKDQGVVYDGSLVTDRWIP